MSRRCLKVCLAVLTLLFLSVLQAQGDKIQYFGLGVDSFATQGIFLAPLPIFHYGAEVYPHLELRGSLGGILIVSALSGDVLYTAYVPDAALRYYAGAGPDILVSFVDFRTAFEFAVHATLGIEYRTSDLVGLFTEVQPFLLLSNDIEPERFVFPGVRFQAGVNFHF